MEPDYLKAFPPIPAHLKLRSVHMEEQCWIGIAEDDHYVVLFEWDGASTNYERYKAYLKVS